MVEAGLVTTGLVTSDEGHAVRDVAMSNRNLQETARSCGEPAVMPGIISTSMPASRNGDLLRQRWTPPEDRRP